MDKHKMLSAIAYILSLLTIGNITVNGDVIVLDSKNHTIDIFPDLPASFGVVLPAEGLRGYVVGSHPANACEPITPPPTGPNITGDFFVLIRRYGCTFTEKVRAAQKAGYAAAIIYNVGSNIIEPMAGVDADDINIPAVFIGQDDGLTIMSHYQFDQGYQIILTNELPFNINSYLLPFAVVIAICFGMMVIFMVVKCIKDRRRMRRYRLPRSSLKKIPVSKFKKGDPYETCAICLDDYVEGDKLRVLPCSHSYHCKCVDPWLTRNRRVCPVCKRRVIVNGEQFSDSESDDDETRPLLSSPDFRTQGGTFDTPTLPVQPAENPVAQQPHRSQQTVVHIESPSPYHVTSEQNGNEDPPDPSENDNDVTIDSLPENGQSTPPNGAVEDADSSVYFTPQAPRRIVENDPSV